MNNSEDKRGVYVSELILTENNLGNEKCEDDLRGCTSNTSLQSPILGRYFKLPDFTKSFDPDLPTLDSTLPYIPVYTHLQTFDLKSIERPKTPPMINKLRSGGSVQLKDPSISRSKAVLNRGAVYQADQALNQSMEKNAKHEDSEATLEDDST